MIVVDASALVGALLDSPRARPVLDRVARGDTTLHAPHVIDLEVVSALRRYARSGELARTAAERSLSDFLALRIERHPHAPLAPRIWELRQNLTAYDAAYVAVAEVLGCPLVTLDSRLARSSPHRIRVEVLN
jgi:predicted nucleic acid-binding protein